MGVFKLSDIESSKKAGNKAFALSEMKRSGINIPEGFVLDSDIYSEIIKESGQNEKIESLLSSLNLDNIEEVSKKLSSISDKLIISDSVFSELKKFIDNDKKYAVRSSGIKEDLEGFSFAGQYESFINVTGYDNIKDAIKKCYSSMFSKTVLSYLLNNKINAENLKMAVIIQEMVDSEISGVAFTVNPISGNDKEIVIEAAAGQGENLVSGKVKAQKYSYNWFDEKITDSCGEILSDEQVKIIAEKALEIQMLFGYPCDIEFAFSCGQLYILQARAITKIMYGSIKDQWTTADFKDGGVSATVCTPYMWSLYEYVWENEFKNFMLDAKILKPSQLRKLGDMFYGRPYWNLSVAKTAMSMVPGYKERDFDSEIGVKITYDGEGQTTKITPKTIAGIIKMALEQKRIVSHRKNNAESLKADLLEKYYKYQKNEDEIYSYDEFKKIWETLVFDDYLLSESTYFRQIFINTIHQSLFKDKILKHTTSGGYFNLIGGLDNISHLLPFYDMWDISRKIREDEKSFLYWKNSNVSDINTALENGESSFFIDEVKNHIKRFGYHSEKELDVTYPCYYEDTKTVIKAFKETVILDEECSPLEDRQRLINSFNKELENIKEKTNSLKYKKLLKTVTDMRHMLWWREEFRDVSTRFYYIIRIYTVRLAKLLVEQRVISCEDDIWFAKIKDIKSYINNETTSDELKKIIARNRKYYRSFENFMSENEIGRVFDVKREQKSEELLCGIGCNNGTVTATARVIESLAETDRLEVGDILVTKFTDTGWTSKFAILSGIITEYGGILCHAAIVSREYGIPCIVCAQDATKLIKDGAKISINGETGKITVIE